jgi:hypothetical protein
VVPEHTRQPPNARIGCAQDECGVPILYAEVNGKRIAKRYSSQDWISLDPAYRVEGADPSDPEALTIASSHKLLTKLLARAREGQE